MMMMMRGAGEPFHSWEEEWESMTQERESTTMNHAYNGGYNKSHTAPQKG